ncbi:hypothetical protein A2454_02440 [Candidatus Peribacteria bacterium RIFOXYC2_FULL_55_14]|nr:MAG: Sugar kinase, ribokinase family [Candidatus Peribacteria bacterium GW2011_GWB1_54_5]KKW42182.1 MAG: Sugar kinase, ribokinase family [Candidatus Peregrinibacteria bacterium GW2011_GWA2_54_9]OGJ71295.1 MAG: hypothetical protein A2198_05840 [Candidatus Peribacteria bacterium RIFOXYA1_FULL_56_14]OGJ74362.1 MAG: hypothetical protein A2384_06565 [Candidatus Peribacteria bacterium RIFOXYB1_FULL_54_35]OGJ75103.1 MAG: hypothetical protein A2217_05235 [Candidatus Peribacteria bacterium RIFOXYA2_F
MSLRTISIGGATYDVFVRLDRSTVEAYSGEHALKLPLGDKIRVQEVIETCGGGASNTAVGLARLGCSAGFCGIIGDDQWGEKLRLNLEREGVDTGCLTVVEGEVSSFSIILSASSGERVILYDPGTNEHLHDATFDRERAGKTDWLYLNHIQEQSCVIEDDIIGMLAQKDGPRLTWNPGGCQIEAGMEAANNSALLARTTLLQLNKGEALKFSKRETVKEAIKALLKKGVKNVVVTDGKNGTDASDGKNLYHCPVVEDNKVLDTTGAGDAFGTGMTWALLSGLPLSEALRAGTINAASVVGTIGAQAGLLTDTEMQRRLKETKLDVDVQPL